MQEYTLNYRVFDGNEEDDATVVISVQAGNVAVPVFLADVYNVASPPAPEEEDDAAAYPIELIQVSKTTCVFQTHEY